MTTGEVVVGSSRLNWLFRRLVKLQTLDLRRMGRRATPQHDLLRRVGVVRRTVPGSRGKCIEPGRSASIGTRKLGRQCRLREANEGKAANTKALWRRQCGASTSTGTWLFANVRSQSPGHAVRARNGRVSRHKNCAQVARDHFLVSPSGAYTMLYAETRVFQSPF